MATLIGDGGHGKDIWACLPSHGGWKWIGHHDDYENDGGLVIIGVNAPQLRAVIAGELGVDDRGWRHPNSYLAGSCSHGYGTHINYGVTMTRTTIGHHTTISPGVTICGDVTIGDRVFIGAGSTIKNLVTIGSDAFIPMGSIVVRDVAEGERYKR